MPIAHDIGATEADEVWRRRSEAKAGAQEREVGELEFAVSKGFTGSGPFATLIFEIEAYPEPKILNSKELRSLIMKFGNSSRTAEAIGACEAFVRQNAGAPR